MSVKERVNNCKEISDNWEVGEQIGSGSCGKTAVYKLLRITRNNTFVEECALKAVTIIEVEGKRTSCTEGFLNDYIQRRDKLVADMENEISLMYTVRDCPNIVTYKDYMFNDWEDETGFGCDLYIRMDFYDTLRKRMRHESFSDSLIANVGVDICRALEVCHKKGIIHRDIKPDNIFINANGDFLLGDFGISKMVDELNRAETRIGTYEYAAPEVVYAKEGESYDETVDIYSLGLVLYELANDGKLPFCESLFASNYEVGIRLRGKPIPKPSGCEKALGEVILKACAFDKEKRYQSASNMRKELSEIDSRKIDTISRLDMSEELYQTLKSDTFKTERESNDVNRKMIAGVAICVVIACIVVIAGVISASNEKRDVAKQIEENNSSISQNNNANQHYKESGDNRDTDSDNYVTQAQTEGVTTVKQAQTEEITTVKQPERLVEEEPSRSIVPAEIICEATTNSYGEKILPKKMYLRAGTVSTLYRWNNPYDSKCYEYAYNMNKNNKGYISPDEDRSVVARNLEPGEYKEIRGHLLITAYDKNDSVEGKKARFRLYIKHSDEMWDTTYDLDLPVDGEPFFYSSHLSDDVVEVAIHVIAPDIPICAYFY